MSYDLIDLPTVVIPNTSNFSNVILRDTQYRDADTIVVHFPLLGMVGTPGFQTSYDYDPLNPGAANWNSLVQENFTGVLTVGLSYYFAAMGKAMRVSSAGAVASNISVFLQKRTFVP